ncbi:MAG: lysylphosphatidylglycerol synthase transmembrane domain-containing protein [Herpetosiphon sp.]
MKVLRFLLNLVGPALLIYVLWITDLRALWRALLDTNLWLLSLSCVLVGPFLLLKGWRWRLILQAWDMPLPLREATALYSIGIFLGVVTPGQAGDAVKAWYLRRRGYSLSAGLASVVVDRLWDLLIMGGLAATGLYFFADVLPGGRFLNVVVVGGVLGLVVFGLALAGSGSLRQLVFGRIILPLLPVNLRSRFTGMGKLHLSLQQLLVIGAVSTLGLGLTFFRTYLLFVSEHQTVPIGPFIALIALVAIVGTFSPGGIGTRDATLVLGLAAILHRSVSVVSPIALSLSTLLLLLNILNVVIGFLFSLRYPIGHALQPVAAEST